MKALGWILFGLLVVALIATNVSGFQFRVSTVQGDLNEMKTQIAAQSAQLSATPTQTPVATATEAPAATETQQYIVVTATAVPATQAPTATASATISPTSEKPLIDQLGPEQHFPGKVNGPAIAEIWDEAQYCAVVEIHEGETLSWNRPGAYWVAASEEVLAKRFPAHAQEYSKNYPNCSILKSAMDVPNPTKP